MIPRIAILSFLIPLAAFAKDLTVSTIGDGWAGNSVNTTIFRRNSVVSDRIFQYTAFYDPDGFVVVAQRQTDRLHSEWKVVRTAFTGNIKDAHNSICIALDGDGYLHLAWDHHNSPLKYAKSLKPHTLKFAESTSMIGENESDVTYPEFYAIAGGDLLFLYRDGESGRGNLVINRYQHASKNWTRVQTKLIDGESQRNAYWQAYASPDSNTVHLSWTWRETWDVSTNHDICYAVSHDAGRTWQRSDGSAYELPITAATAEYAARIPQNSELINQTSMAADAKGRPYVTSYWTPTGSDVPQFHLIYFDGDDWETSQITNRQTSFSLSGGGTKRIPISRPQILADSTGNRTKAYLVYRDIERQNRPTLASCDDLSNPEWRFTDLSESDLGQWEPSYDIPLWHREKRLALFIQKTAQGDGERTESLPPQPVSILYRQP